MHTLLALHFQKLMPFSSFLTIFSASQNSFMLTTNCEVGSRGLKLPTIQPLPIGFTRKQRAKVKLSSTLGNGFLSKYRSLESYGVSHLRRRVGGRPQSPVRLSKPQRSVSEDSSDSISSDSLISEGGRILKSPNPFTLPRGAKMDTRHVSTKLTDRRHPPRCPPATGGVNIKLEPTFATAVLSIPNSSPNVSDLVRAMDSIDIGIYSSPPHRIPT